MTLNDGTSRRRAAARLAGAICLLTGLTACTSIIDRGDDDAAPISDVESVDDTEYDETDDTFDDDDYDDETDDTFDDDDYDDETDDTFDDDDETDDTFYDDETDDADDDDLADDGSESDGGGAPTTVLDGGMVVTYADGVSRPLETSCFDTDPIVIPDEFEFISLPGEDACDFAMQGPIADQAVIAGELWISSSGKSFDEQVDFMRENLLAGTEPDIRILQLLNTGPSGEPLEIYSEEELDGYQRSVIFRHSSNRRDGYEAYSAAVEVPQPSDGSTAVIFIWSILEDGYDYVVEFIESMNTKLPPGLE